MNYRRLLTYGYAALTLLGYGATLVGAGCAAHENSQIERIVEEDQENNTLEYALLSVAGAGVAGVGVSRLRKQ